MAGSNTYAALTLIFREVLENPTVEIGPDSSPASVPGWDSFKTVMVLMRMEDELGCEFDSREMTGLRSASDLAQLFEAHEAGQPAG